MADKIGPNMDLRHYKTLVFDCDGVLLNSNKIKTRAFYLAALPYGEQAAQALADYHVSNGGISRYKKFEYFLSRILGAPDPDESMLERLLDAYADEAWRGLLSCEVAGGIAALRDKTEGSRWLVVSGGDQEEIRRLFARRDLARFFDGGIFGSPDPKDRILQREMQTGNIRKPAVFLGDTRYDHQAAKNAGLDFVFISRWSEFAGWREYCRRHFVVCADSLAELSVGDGIR